MSTAPTRQAVNYCPFCAEEDLFPTEDGGWDCRSCLRAFQVKFLGLVPHPSDASGPPSDPSGAVPS